MQVMVCSLVFLNVHIPWAWDIQDFCPFSMTFGIKSMHSTSRFTLKYGNLNHL